MTAAAEQSWNHVMMCISKNFIMNMVANGTWLKKKEACYTGDLSKIFDFWVHDQLWDTTKEKRGMSCRVI